MSKILFVLILLSIFSGCEQTEKFVYIDNPSDQKRSEKVHEIRNIFHDAKIDILFVVDNSGSMYDIQSNIVKNSKLFMSSFLQNNFMKWRMGIVSTDKKDDPYLGFNPSNWFDHTMISRDVNPLTPAMVVSGFQDAINSLGTGGDGYEYIFYNALRPMLDTDPRTNHSSFFRRDAHLAIIMVTDEEEQSEEKWGSSYEALTLINAIKSMKESDKVVRFYGAFNFPDLQDCSGWGNGYAGSPFETIISETSGIFMSACTKDFGKDLAEIGKDIISIVDTPSILLVDRPVLDTLEVYYNDTYLKPGKRSEGGVWYYSHKYNTINFYSLDFAPDFSDSKIKINFDIADGVDRRKP